MKTRHEIFSDVRALICSQFDLPPEAVTLNADLYADLKFDSLDSIDLLIGIEKMVGRRVSPDEFADLRTVADAVDGIFAVQSKAA